MAIAYSGIRAQSVMLQVTDLANGGAPQNIYINTAMAKLQPMITAPFILNYIKNTNVTSPNENVNSRYYYSKKSGKAIAYTNSNGTLIDPRTQPSEEIRVLAGQLEPVSVIKKFEGSLRDLTLPGLEQTAAITIANYIVERRLDKQEEAYGKLLKAAQKVQTNNLTGINTFKTGAHVVKATYADADALYADLKTAMNSFRKLGASNAYGTYNKNLDMVRGIPTTDMIILISPECGAMLLEKPGLFASDAGNELFKKLNLKLFLGTALYITETLPEGVNFIIITTGQHGSLGYEEVGLVSAKVKDGDNIEVIENKAMMVRDPNWSGYYRIDYEEIYKSGVIFDDLIFVSTENDIDTTTKDVSDLTQDDVKKSKSKTEQESEQESEE